MIDFVGLLVLLVLVILFAYLTIRSWGSQRGILKWVGLVLSGLLTLVFGILLIVAVMGTLRLNQNYDASHPVAQVQVASTPEQIAQGERIAHFCAGCHSPDGQLPLRGNNFAAEVGFPIGTLYAPNLTPSHLGTWSDGEIIRAIREGVTKSGRSLIIMPSEYFKHFADEDVQAIVAYLRSQPAATPDTPPNNLNVLGAILVNAFPIFTVQPHITAPIPRPEGVTAQRGEYLVNFLGCRGCHGESLTGGEGFAGPAPNIAVVVPQWTETDFVNLIRTGKDPEGHQVDAERMPYKEFSQVATDDELKAIFLYLKGLQK